MYISSVSLLSSFSICRQFVRACFTFRVTIREGQWSKYTATKHWIEHVFEQRSCEDIVSNQKLGTMTSGYEYVIKCNYESLLPSSTEGCALGT